jgi:hypothetical protein
LPSFQDKNGGYAYSDEQKEKHCTLEWRAFFNIGCSEEKLFFCPKMVRNI